MSTDTTAIYLSENLFELNCGSSFLANVGETERAELVSAGNNVKVNQGESVFNQGDTHNGIWIIDDGRIRTFYAGPSGKEITLAFWSMGHFVGGPEVFGKGKHLWSASAMEDSKLLFLNGDTLRQLAFEYPSISIAIIEGLEGKGKAYSALIQMLGTRSVSERLQQLLLILVDHHSSEHEGSAVITRTMTNEQIATIVGATRQWVTQSLDNLQKKGVLTISRKQIVVHYPECLTE
ncbi:MAG: Crp/Fnr family transcriptional regulator [Gammaproteobacteria bacterium]|nr:Crp/Fnr family transcriptional regulator [Gammaproteobacteria bacterium]